MLLLTSVAATIRGMDLVLLKACQLSLKGSSMYMSLLRDGRAIAAIKQGPLLLGLKLVI